MRLFRAQYKDKSGKVQKSKRWYIDFRDHNQIRRGWPAFEDKKQSGNLGRQIERLVSSRMAGEKPDAELTRWLENIPGSLRKKLVKIGLLDAHRAAAGKPLSKHLEDFKSFLQAKGNTDNRVNTAYTRIKKVFDGCKFNYWSELSASKIHNYISSLLEGKEPLSQKTANYYLREVKQFCRWMVQDRRAIESPVEYLKPIEVTEEEKRAALEPAEIDYLIHYTEHGENIYQISGPERAAIYVTAIYTGLRANEIRALRASSFDFENKIVNLPGRDTKNSRDAIQSLKDEIIDRVKPLLQGKAASSPAFKMPSRYNMARMLRKDLQAARTAWLKEVEKEPELLKERTDSDFLKDDKATGKVDFHSLRHTCGSLLAAAGVHPKTAQEIMRHSDINLTMGRYTHTYRGQVEKAIQKLPKIGKVKTTEKQAAATGTDGKPVDSNLCVYLCSDSRPDKTIDDDQRQTNFAKSSETPISNAPGGIRTPALRIRNPLLYPAELRAPFFAAHPGYSLDFPRKALLYSGSAYLSRLKNRLWSQDMDFAAEAKNLFEQGYNSSQAVFTAGSQQLGSPWKPPGIGPAPSTSVPSTSASPPNSPPMNSTD